MAEQTLTINTLAATVITPSDVSQFSLDDVAPNIINGGGGTIVDVSGIVALASQVAELDSDVTVLESNVATVQADVTALQEDVSGLDATVAQVQTTATAAAETANEAMGVATAASETAQYALNAGTAKIAYTISNPDPGKPTGPYGVGTTTTRTDNIYKIRLGNTTDLVYVAHAETAQYALQVQSAASATSLNYTNNFNQVGQLQATVTWADKSLQFNDGNGVNLVAATAAYALAVAGDSSGGGFDGSYAGSEVMLSASGSTLVLNASGVVLTASDNKSINLLTGSDVQIGSSSATIITLNGHVRISTDPENVSIGDNALPDVIKSYAGDSSEGGYPPLVQPTGSNLYYGIVNDASSLRFGSFGNADGSQEEAVLKVNEDDIYVTSLGRQGTNTTLTYGLAVAPPELRFGTWAADTGDGANMYEGIYIPNSTLNSRIAVGSFSGADSTRVWGLVANSTTSAFGEVTHSPSGASIDVITGMEVSNQYVLLTTNYNASVAKSALEMTSTGATLSAMFTLNNGETTIAPADWAKLKSLADRASDILALLNS